MEKYELNKFILEYKVKLNDLFDAFQIEKKKIEYKDLDSKINDSNFWDNQKEAQRIISRFNVIKDIITKCEDLKLKFDDINETIESALTDSDIMELLESEIEEFKTDIKSLEEDALLSGKYDFNDCILELHPGAGGTESMDWADMLYRMYLRFLSQKGYKVNVLDYQAGSDAGIKSVSIEVSGPFAYGRLKGERGVHRLVRISPFDSNASRHTSFCSVDISPMIDDVSEIVIKDDEIKIDVYRSSGKGGQGVNTTDSAVRITHLPTKIVVTCQNERSQIKNKEFAMNVLKSRLLEKKIREQEAELKNLKGEQMEINFGSQIRSYVFTPYTMVKDHRTGYEVSNVEGVMNGDLDGFIEAYLKYEAKNR